MTNMSLNENLMTSIPTARTAGSDEALARMKILLRTDEFLIAFLLYLTKNCNFAATDPFLSSTRVIQNIIDFSGRSLLTQSFADVYFEAAMNELTADEIQQKVKNLIDNTVANENLMAETALYVFPKFMECRM